MADTIQFNTELNGELYQELQSIAKDENVDVQLVIKKALSDFVVSHKNGKPRDEIMKMYEASLEKYSPLYERLAK